VAKNAQIKQTDRGMRKLMAQVERWSSVTLSVGVHQREGKRRYPGGLSVSEVARLHANGTRRMPRRDPVGDWAVSARRRVITTGREALAETARTGQSPMRRLELAGRKYVAEVREQFAIQPRLAPATIERKGSSKILVEHGLLWRAITFQVQLGKRTRG
jgi:hypothetical protein